MKENRPLKDSGMPLLIKATTRFVIGPTLLFGIYTVLHGHISPGGGFAGGVIIALSFVQLVLVFGKDTMAGRLSRFFAANLETLGALMFLMIATMGFLGGAFFKNILEKGRPFELLSAGTIFLSNIAIGLKVAVGLFTIFLTLVILEGSRKIK